MQRRNMFIRKPCLQSEIKNCAFLKVCRLHNFREAFCAIGLFALWRHMSIFTFREWSQVFRRHSQQSNHHNNPNDSLGKVYTFLCTSSLLTPHHDRSQPTSFGFRARMSTLRRSQLRHSRPVHISTPVLDSSSTGPVSMISGSHVLGSRHSMFRFCVKPRFVGRLVSHMSLRHVAGETQTFPPVVLLLVPQARVRTTTDTV